MTFVTMKKFTFLEFWIDFSNSLKIKLPINFSLKLQLEINF